MYTFLLPRCSQTPQLLHAELSVPRLSSDLELKESDDENLFERNVSGLGLVAGGIGVQAAGQLGALQVPILERLNAEEKGAFWFLNFL